MAPMAAPETTAPFEGALHTVAWFVPRLFVFLAILAVGWLAARALRSTIMAALRRAGVGRVAGRADPAGVGRRARTRARPGTVGRLGVNGRGARVEAGADGRGGTRVDAVDLAGRLGYYAFLIFVLHFAFGVWGPNPVSDLIEAVIAWLPRAAVAIVLVVVSVGAASVVRDLVGGAPGNRPYGSLPADVAGVFVVGVGIVAALSQVGVASTVTVAVLVAGVATVAGILIVGVGGGLVRPMRARWEAWLDRAERELAERSGRRAAGPWCPPGGDFQPGATGQPGATEQPTVLIRPFAGVRRGAGGAGPGYPGPGADAAPRGRGVAPLGEAPEESTAEVPTVAVPTVEMPTVAVPTMEMPAVEVPTVEMPTATVSTVKVPSVEVPTVGAPRRGQPWPPRTPRPSRTRRSRRS